MKETVLLIDDDPISNFISRKLFERIDPKLVIYTVLNGKEAMVLIRTLFSTGKPCPGLILLDLNMPVMDGFEFLSVFRSLLLCDGYNPVIIVTSSSMDPMDMKRAFEFGVQDYLSKPLSEKVLRTAVQSTLDKHLYAA